MSGVKIQKVGGEPVPVKTAGFTRRGMKTFPRSAMRGSRLHRSARGPDKLTKGIEGVKDPARPPPLKKTNRSTLRIMTEEGVKQRRKTIKQRVRGMSDQDVRKTLEKSKISVGTTTPSHIVREILEGGMEAGMIVAK